MTLKPQQIVEGMARAYSGFNTKEWDTESMQAALRFLIEHAGECEELYGAGEIWAINNFLTVLTEAK